jgi:hypothetical protein
LRRYGKGGALVEGGCSAPEPADHADRPLRRAKNRDKGANNVIGASPITGRMLPITVPLAEPIGGVMATINYAPIITAAYLQRLAQVLILVLAFGHETLLEGPEDQGARRRRPRGAQGGSREDLLGLGAHHQALAQATPRDRRRRAQADPRSTLRQGRGARGLAAHAPPRERRRPHARGAPRGVRGSPRRRGGLGVHGRAGHRAPAGRVAAQKSRR